MLDILIAALLIGASLVAQETSNGLTVAKLAAMGEAGLSEDLMLAAVRRDGKPMDLNADDLLALKKAKVPDTVVRALLLGGATPPPATRSASAWPSEVGVYFKKGTDWAELLPEVVNWKTGGVLKTLGTGGLVNGDLNGHLSGAGSRTQVTSPVELLIVSHEGVAISEFQLLRLRQNKNNREFRMVTGGVLHMKGGAARDTVAFEGKKVAPRTWLVSLPSTIGAGEYGLMPPGAMGSASSTSVGKLYTFRFLE